MINPIKSTIPVRAIRLLARFPVLNKISNFMNPIKLRKFKRTDIRIFLIVYWFILLMQIYDEYFNLPNYFLLFFDIFSLNFKTSMISGFEVS